MTNKVLFTASTFSHITNFHLPYLEWFRERGWSVHVACGGKPMPIAHADRVVELPFRKRMGAAENFRAAWELRKLIREEEYALISTHSALAAFFTRLAVKGMRGRPPVANTAHGYLFDDDTPALRRWVLLAAERLTAPETDLLMTMNEWDDRLARKEKLGKEIVRIPGMGVDYAKLDRFGAEDGQALRRKLGIPGNAFVLIYPAEFSKRKSQEVLIRAMAEIPERAVLVLPGEGDLLEACRELAGKLNLRSRVRFPGQVREMGAWYAMADAAVSASRIEGLPFNAMEAMHSGLPVVASRIKGHTDLIAEGVTGLLYPYGDAPACAAAIRRLMESPALCQRLGASARQSAAAYSLPRAFPRITAAYESLLPELKEGEMTGAM